MAKGKKGKGRNYVSQGQRPNVSQKTLNDMNRSRAVSVDSIMKSSEMMSKEKKSIIEKAEALYFEFKDKVTWAACVQAVKTNYIPTFKNKYYERGTAQKARAGKNT